MSYYMGRDDYPKERQVNDNVFQKVKWKKNRIKLNGWDHDVDDITSWIVEHTKGNWHFKENFTRVSTGACRTGNESNITFWFELDEDAALFKLTWL